MSDEKKEMKIELSDQVLEAMANDPKIASLIRDFSANMRQAKQLVDDGKYAELDDALRALGMEPKRLSDEEVEELGIDLEVEVMKVKKQ